MSKTSLEKLTLSAEDFRAKTLALQEKGLDWLVPELDSSSMHSLSQRTSKQKLSSWRMSQDFYQATTDAISESSLLVWPTQGIATSNGVCLIRNSSESPSVAVESSLSQVLEAEVSPKYSLSAKAAEGIIRRAERRGKTLPEPLKKALMSVVGKPE
jgi:hypothetical protein